MLRVKAPVVKGNAGFQARDEDPTCGLFLAI